jgi:fucose-binding lectin II (PA-IIL)
MANCTSVGVAGANIPLGNVIPSGAFVFLEGFAQSAAKQTAEVKQGATVVAKIEGTGPAARMVPPSGSTDHFIAGAGPYTVTISNGGSQKSQVIRSFDATVWGSTVYGAAFGFASEDTPNGGDCDFNDSVVTLGWTTKAG